MKYSINRTKRNLIILCSLFLILFKITMGLYYFFIGPIKMEPLLSGMNNLLYLIPYSYLMLVFVDYFKQTKLKALQIITTIILSVEIVTSVCSFINLYNPLIPKIVISIISSIWFIAIIVWILSLFQTKMKDYIGLLSIRYFAAGILLYLLLGIITLIPGLVKRTDIFAALQLVNVTSAIPFIFSLNFGMKIQGEKIED